MSPNACFGDCIDCGRQHALPQGEARSHARELMGEFEAIRRLDYLAPESEADPLLSFDHLFMGAHGNMFGVLECRDEAGGTVVLRAFSSLRRGIRDVAGWVPPVLSADTYYGIIVPEQEKLLRMTGEMQHLHPEGARYRELEAERRRTSQALLEEMRDRYVFQNFRGESRSLREVWARDGGIPGGVGECCAPKLLNHAALRGLHPVSLAEFYWGGPAGARGREQGEIYPSCEQRCRPILGFLLCGIDDGV